MAKIWNKGYDLDALIEQFTVGDDHVLDLRLARFDILGSIAHAKMLESIKILSAEESTAVCKGLVSLLAAVDAGDFTISREQEDVHTAVEEALGNVGGKLHAGRSRNDQVLVDIRMYSRARLLDFRQATFDCAKTIVDFACKHEFVPMPGRTHTQPAMPSSVGTWAGAFAESLLDDASLLEAVYRLNNQCPLGSAAGYGVSLPLDREMTARLLGFDRVQNNVLYVQNSRGKFEAAIIFALSQVVDDLARLAGDTILFSTPEFGYFSLPEKLCSGSSIMPQKRNPDVLELIRAKASTIAALAAGTASIVRNIPSGYNRDLQETKGALMQAFDIALGSVVVTGRVFEQIAVNEDVLRKSFSGDMFAADEATRLAASGTPFREAYKAVAERIDSLPTEDPLENIRAKTHTGAPGNLGLKALADKIVSCADVVSAEKKRVEEALKELIG